MKQKLAEHMLLCGRQGGHLRHIQEVFMWAAVKDTSEAESCWCWAAKAQCSCFSTREPQINVWCEFQGRGDEEINDPDRRRDSARWSPMTTFPGNLFTLLGELLGERWNRLEMTAYTLPKSSTVRFTAARTWWLCCLHAEILITASLNYQSISSSWFYFCACKKAITFPLGDFIRGLYNVGQLCVHSQIQFGEKGRLLGEFEPGRTHVNHNSSKI